MAEYFNRLSLRDWDALVELCAESVEYNPPPDTPWTQTIRGREPFRRHTAEVFASFPDAKFELLQVRWLPRGAIARFRSTWSVSALERTQEGAVLFAFAGDTIAKIGVELDHSIWSHSYARL
jgi:allantoicase